MREIKHLLEENLWIGHHFLIGREGKNTVQWYQVGSIKQKKDFKKKTAFGTQNYAEFSPSVFEEATGIELKPGELVEVCLVIKRRRKNK